MSSLHVKPVLLSAFITNLRSHINIKRSLCFRSGLRLPLVAYLFLFLYRIPTEYQVKLTYKTFVIFIYKRAITSSLSWYLLKIINHLTLPPFHLHTVKNRPPMLYKLSRKLVYLLVLHNLTDLDLQTAFFRSFGCTYLTFDALLSILAGITGTLWKIYSLE